MQESVLWWISASDWKARALSALIAALALMIRSTSMAIRFLATSETTQAPHDTDLLTKCVRARKFDPSNLPESVMTRKPCVGLNLILGKLRKWHHAICHQSSRLIQEVTCWSVFLVQGHCLLKMKCLRDWAKTESHPLERARHWQQIRMTQTERVAKLKAAARVLLANISNSLCWMEGPNPKSASAIQAASLIPSSILTQFPNLPFFWSTVKECGGVRSWEVPCWK